MLRWDPEYASVAGRLPWVGPALPLLAAFYLGWFLQASLVQIPFDYTLAPQVFVGLALLLSWNWSGKTSRRRGFRTGCYDRVAAVAAANSSDATPVVPKKSHPTSDSTTSASWATRA